MATEETTVEVYQALYPKIEGIAKAFVRSNPDLTLDWEDLAGDQWELIVRKADVFKDRLDAGEERYVVAALRNVVIATVKKQRAYEHPDHLIYSKAQVRDMLARFFDHSSWVSGSDGAMAMVTGRTYTWGDGIAGMADLASAFKRLNEDAQRALAVRYLYPSWEWDEIAEHLGITEHAARKRHTRALNSLVRNMTGSIRVASKAA